jgi:TfoX/Sxy family transcriptional regulator of competence genes
VAYDAGMVERLRDALARLGEGRVREKHVFGGRGFLEGTRAFVIAGSDRLLVKVPPDEYADACAQPGVAPFAPGGERPMGTWLAVDADAVADDPEFSEWVARGLRGIRAAPAAGTARRRR